MLRTLGQWLLPPLLVASGLVLGVAGPASAAAANGTGTMTTKTTSVTYGSTGHVITFTYTAATGGVSNGGVHLTVPAGWSAPSTTGTSAGYTTASTGTVSIDGQTIVVLGVTLAAGATLDHQLRCQGRQGTGRDGDHRRRRRDVDRDGEVDLGRNRDRARQVAGHHGDRDPGHTGRAVGLARFTEFDRRQLHARTANAKSSTVTVRLAKDGSFVKAVEGNTIGHRDHHRSHPGRHVLRDNHLRRQRHRLPHVRRGRALRRHHTGRAHDHGESDRT